MSRPVIADKRAALLGGLVCAIGGAWMLTQAWEARGATRPWWARLIPAVP